jgi:hypothetical protein
MRRGQAKHKTKDYRAFAGLEDNVKKNGGTSTPKTEKNVNLFIDAVENIVENSSSFWD